MTCSLLGTSCPVALPPGPTVNCERFGPDLTLHFATAHDLDVLVCLSRILSSQSFRVLLLRRLHLPLPLSSLNCRCGRPLDCFGHHRSACAVSGVLGRRGGRTRVNERVRAGFGSRTVQSPGWPSSGGRGRWGCNCLVGPSWPLTQLLFQLCVGTAPQGKAQPIVMALP